MISQDLCVKGIVCGVSFAAAPMLGAVVTNGEFLRQMITGFVLSFLNIRSYVVINPIQIHPVVWKMTYYTAPIGLSFAAISLLGLAIIKNKGHASR